MSELTIGDALEYGIQAHRSGKLKEADKYYTAILKVKPDHPDANHNMGLLALQLGKIDEGIDFLETALESDNTRERFWISLINALLKVGRQLDASQKFSLARSKGLRLFEFIPNIEELSDGEQGLNLNELVDLLRKNELFKLYSILDIKLAKHPKSPELHSLKGAALAKSGYHLKAIESYHLAVRLNDKSPDILNNLGQSYYALKQIGLAEDSFRSAVTLDPSHIGALLNLGVVSLEKGDLSCAMQSFKKVLVEDPVNQGCLLNLQNLLLQAPKLCFERRIDFPEKLIQNPKYLIRGAISAYIKANSEELIFFLRKYKLLSKEIIENLNQKDQKFCEGYNTFLNKCHREWPEGNTEKGASIIYHIGDSHCLSYAHAVIKSQNTIKQIVPRITLGGKAFHLAALEENRYKAITKFNLKSISKGSQVLISFGEIDCRADEGFLLASKKHNKPIGDLIAQTANGFINWFEDKNKALEHKLIFLSVPAPVYNDNLSELCNLRVRDCVREFNIQLNKCVDDAGFEYLDLYQPTSNRDGFSNQIHHIDAHHLGRSAIKYIAREVSG